MRNELVGWDDGKIYFYDMNGNEFGANDHPDLLKKIVEICAGYFIRGEG